MFVKKVYVSATDELDNYIICKSCSLSVYISIDLKKNNYITVPVYVVRLVFTYKFSLLVFNAVLERTL